MVPSRCIRSLLHPLSPLTSAGQVRLRRVERGSDGPPSHASAAPVVALTAAADRLSWVRVRSPSESDAWCGWAFGRDIAGLDQHVVKRRALSQPPRAGEKRGTRDPLAWP
jgi:hypothetical protein